MPRLHYSQRLAAPLEEVFAFHADPYNLIKITPPSLNLKVTNPEKVQMAAGAEITYTIRLGGLPVHWLTEITSYKPPHSFTDVQRRGPYRTWEHTHTFRADGPDHTIVTDDVHYEVPLGLVGRIFAGWIVRRQVEEIFAHRARVLEAHFAGQNRPR